MTLTESHERPTASWLFVRTRNVLWPFLAHALNNGLALVLARLGF
jgi:membrane protease YdiL (CAAX protease family)